MAHISMVDHKNIKHNMDLHLSELIYAEQCTLCEALPIEGGQNCFYISVFFGVIIYPLTTITSG